MVTSPVPRATSWIVSRHSWFLWPDISQAAQCPTSTPNVQNFTSTSENEVTSGARVFQQGNDFWKRTRQIVCLRRIRLHAPCSHSRQTYCLLLLRGFEPSGGLTTSSVRHGSVDLKELSAIGREQDERRHSLRSSLFAPPSIHSCPGSLRSLSEPQHYQSRPRQSRCWSRGSSEASQISPLIAPFQSSFRDRLCLLSHLEQDRFHKDCRDELLRQHF